MQGFIRPGPSTTAPPSPPSSPHPHNAKTMAAPTTLHQFTLLPAELRNMIWEASLPEPRVFDIYPASPSQKKTTPQQGLRFANKYTEPPPALTAVCRESRSLALHHYSPLTLDGTTKYVDLCRDVLLLESCLLGRSLLRTLLFMSQIPLIRDNLRSLAFGTSYGAHTGVWHAVLGWNTQPTNNSMGKFLQRLGAFAVLERLVFVVHQEMHFEVARMPSPKEVGSMTMGGEYRGSGKGRGLMAGAELSRNTTVYQAGSSPPAPRALSAEPVSSVPSSPCSTSSSMTSSSSPSSSPSSSTSSSPSSSTRRSGPLDPAFYLTGSNGNKGCLYRVPWTSEKPWLPHANHIAYYPPMADADDGKVQEGTTNQNGPDHPRDHYNYNNNNAAKESPNARPSHGLFPTEDDWIRFRRIIKRDVEAGIKLGLAERAAKPRPCRKRKQAVVEEEDGNLMQQYLQQQDQILQQQQSPYEQVPPYKTTATKRARKLAASEEAERRRRLPAIEGATLVWRYSLPSS